MLANHEASITPTRLDTLASAKSGSIGPYQLCMELASGGMAKVFLARARYGESTGFVALKLIHAHFSNDRAFVEMFIDEAAIASQIRHANVCSVYDYGYAGGQHYLAMEYIAGESLGAIWRKLSENARGKHRCAHSARLIAHALAGACEGLHAAHELTDGSGEPLEIVHRDVTPENILLSYDGVAKVVDFGVASAAEQHHRTRTGVLKGKIAYVAPEVLQGKRADRRADVWGIGVTAWELFTGRRLFRAGSDLETLRAVTDSPIVAPSELAPELPRALDQVVLRALERDRDHRYASARELGQALLKASASDGEVVGLADLAEWMNTLFPAGKQRNRDRLELIGQVTARPPALVGPSAPLRRSSPDDLTDSDTERPETSPRSGVGSSPSGSRLSRSARRTGLARLKDAPGYRWVIPCAALLLGLLIGRWPDRPASAEARAESSRPEAAEGSALPLPVASEGAGNETSSLLTERGPYLVRVEQRGDELVLRVQAPDGAPTPPAPAAESTAGEPPRAQPDTTGATP